MNAALDMTFEHPVRTDPDQELLNVSIYVEPLLSYPDQYILVCTGNRGLLLFAENLQKVLSPMLGSKDDLWQALGTWSADASVLTDHIMDILTQGGTDANAPPLSVSFLGQRYSVETRFIMGIDTPGNLVLNFLPETQTINTAGRSRAHAAYTTYAPPAAPVAPVAPTLPAPPVAAAHVTPGLGSPGCGSFFGFSDTPESAREYTLKLNDYVKSCRNDDIYYSDNQTEVSWQAGRRGSLMGEFIPSMASPELENYLDMVQEREVVSLRVSMDTYFYDPVDPDSVPPSYSVNNTSNTGDAGARIARRAAHGSNNLNGDKRCHACGAEKSPEWRKGPEGPKTLCNACGLRYAKQLRAGNA